MMSWRANVCWALLAWLALSQVVSSQTGSTPANAQREPEPERKQQQVVASMATASSGSMSPPEGSARRPPTRMMLDSDRDPPEEPERRKPNRKRPPQSYDYEDEECYDEEDPELDPTGGFMRMANQPMRQMRRLMGHMFQRMHELDYGQGGDDRTGMVASSASSFSGGSGDQEFSRTSSQVRGPDGRLRGIVSETRNGRTKVRRIGRAEDQDEDLDEE